VILIPKKENKEEHLEQRVDIIVHSVFIFSVVYPIAVQGTLSGVGWYIIFSPKEFSRDT